MYNSKIDKIINEEVNALITEGVMDDLRSIFTKLLPKLKKNGKKKKSKEEKKKEKEREKKKDEEKPDMRRKKVVGGTKMYDYDKYKDTHREVNKADYDSIIDQIDQENTDIAAVARDVFPDHTDEGAQSQLRKILNHERPMTEPVAKILRKLISTGRIAVKG
jgi:hypothetical protein